MTGRECLETSEAWRQFVEPCGMYLEQNLRDVADWGSCCVCQREYHSTLVGHLVGQKHWKNLWWLAQEGKEPKQEWRKPDGRLIRFNHLTGQVTVSDAGQQPVDANMAPSYPGLAQPTQALQAMRPPKEVQHLQQPAARHHKEQEDWEAGHLFCSVCCSLKAKGDFYKNEAKWSVERRKCKDCFEKPLEPVAAAQPTPLPKQAQRPATQPVSKEQEDWTKGRLFCSECCSVKAKGDFYNAQAKWSVEKRKCKDCFEAEEMLSLHIVCAVCSYRLHRDQYHKKMDHETPVCKSCKEKQELESSRLVCRICLEKKERGEFRNKVNWDAPECASCLSRREKDEYADWLRQQEEERERMASLRETMAEVELRRNYEQCIRERMRRLPEDEEEVTLEEERLGLAQNLTATILEMTGAELDDAWRHETPSRVHASDREAAERFKAYEDEGDELCKQLSSEIYIEYVGNQEICDYMLRPLLRDLRNDTRSLLLKNRVVASIRAADDRRQGVLAKLPDVTYDAGWKRLGPQELCLLQSLPDMELRVKTFPYDLWKNIEEDLYEDNGSRGSHNQILQRLLSISLGTGEGANRTETMNYCADLLGFRGKDLQYEIWAEQFKRNALSIEIDYGWGKEFKADNLWQRKKEANVLEALLGALHRSDSERARPLCRAVCGLAVLCHAAPARASELVPSNWAMADKVLDTAEKMSSCPALYGGDLQRRSLLRKYLDQERFLADMERWIFAPAKKANKMR